MKHLIEQARALLDSVRSDPKLERATRGALHAVQRLHLLSEYRKRGEPEGPLARPEDIDTDDARVGKN